LIFLPTQIMAGKSKYIYLSELHYGKLCALIFFEDLRLNLLELITYPIFPRRITQNNVNTVHCKVCTLTLMVIGGGIRTAFMEAQFSTLFLRVEFIVRL